MAGVDDTPPGWVISVDYIITRRKMYHAVFSPERENRFQSRRFWECVEWLDAEGVEAYAVVASAPGPPYRVASVKVTKGT